MYFDNGGKLKYHSGKIPKDLLVSTKFTFEKALTKPTAQILKARKDLYYAYNSQMSRTDLARKCKRLLLDLYAKIPKTGRISYDSENMQRLKSDVDGVTEFILTKNSQTRDKFYDFKLALAQFEIWKDERNYRQGSNYQEDMFRRLGNVTINTALAIGKMHEELEKMEIKTANYKAYKKQLRKREWDKIFAMWEYFAKCDQRQIDEFIYMCKQREYREKQMEYENYKNSRQTDFEM